MKRMPKYLYHYSSKENRLSIIKNGLIGSHQGKWCIYLAENIDTWKNYGNDCYKISTKNLNPSDFTSTGDENLDEVLYWGKIDDKIMISKNDIELIEIKE